MTKIPILRILCMVIVSFATVLNAQLVDNGDGTITDTAKDIMWTKNAKLPGSSTLTYLEAVAWVTSLDYAGYTDWRLPGGIDPRNDPNGNTADSQYYYNCSASEFGNLFYNVLGGTAGLKVDEMYEFPVTIVPNTDPDLVFFENIMGVSANGSTFWSSIQKDATHTWTFSFWRGSYAALLSSAGSTYRMRAWAVRDVSGGQPQPGSNESPSNFATLDGYDGAVPLAWSAPANMTGFQGYDVHRYTIPGAYTELASLIQNQYFRDETAVNGTSYYYSVSARYASGESDMVTTILGTPVEDGYTLPCGPADPLPTLDGHIQSSEWASAETIDITYPGVPDLVTLYAMNDQDHLYLAVDDPGDNTLNDYDGIGFIFDEDLDREWPPGLSDQEGILQIYWKSGSVESWFQSFYGTWPDGVAGSAWNAPSGMMHQMSTTSGHVQLEASLDLDTSPFNGTGGDVIGAFFYALDASDGFHGAWPQETANHLRVIASGNAWAHGAFAFGDLTLSGYSDVGEDQATVPVSYSISQNYPNPFNPQTRIEYTLPALSDVRIDVFNVKGERVEILVNQKKAAGIHSITWDGRDHRGQLVPGGIYFCRIQAGDYKNIIRMLFVK